MAAQAEDLAAETLQPSDLIVDWYDPLTAERLLTLSNLRQRI